MPGVYSAWKLKYALTLLVFAAEQFNIMCPVQLASCTISLPIHHKMQVVKARAAGMAAAAATGRPHGMLSVLGLEDVKLQELCSAARANCEAGTVCQIANMLFPSGRVVSGHKVALDKVQICNLCCPNVILLTSVVIFEG